VKEKTRVHEKILRNHRK